MASPRAGVDYLRSFGEMQAWFRTDADCLDYLAWLRWPEVRVPVVWAARGLGPVWRPFRVRGLP